MALWHVVADEDSYEHLVATDSAVIALARPPEPAKRIRHIIREHLRLPPETSNEADFVHTTPSGIEKARESTPRTKSKI